MQAPDRKVSIGNFAIGAPVAAIVAWVWNGFMPDYLMTPEIAAAVGALVAAIAAYMVPNK